MDSKTNPNGTLETRYLAFLETMTQLRPRLHRYCSRMTGSVLDGEDVVQDALFEAYRKLDQFDDSRPLAPWIFRIAHNRCIDFLRRRGVHDAAEATVKSDSSNSVASVEPVSLGVRPAIEHLVQMLPAKERAGVLLKDVFDYSLEEIAELVDSTVGGVKAALKRGRTKLAATHAPAHQSSRTTDPELQRVLNLYVERFNRQDWDGLRELISADAQVRVVDAFEGRLDNAPYFSNYARLSVPWKLTVGQVDGEPVVVALRRGADAWVPYGFVRLLVSGQRIDWIVDYSHCPWVAELAEHVVTTDMC